MTDNSKEKRRAQIDAIADAWDEPDPNAKVELADAETTKRLNDGIDEALGLKSITIRLQATLIDDLKRLARKNGIGYQPLIRQVLTKYAAEQAYMPY